MKIIASSFALCAALIASGAAQASTTLITGDQLLISTGSKFGMELSPGNTVWTSMTQFKPITIGLAQLGGGGHSGVPDGNEPGAIDNAWSFFGSTGLHYTAAPVRDNGNGTLDLSGWRMSWNNVQSINLGGGLPATFNWDGVYGHAYTLFYQANVPQGDPSGFGGVLYTLNLAGTVQAVPVPAAAWLLGSGLLGLIGVARRKQR